MLIAFIISVLIIVIDQITKFCLYGMSCSLIGDFLWLESTLNTGVAFSMFEGKSIFFFVIAMIASAVMIYLICSKKWLKIKTEKMAIALILGGTISNAIDRLVFGGVRDFIYLKFMNFAIFNVADMAITIGAVLFCVAIIFMRDRKKDVGT